VATSDKHRFDARSDNVLCAICHEPTVRFSDVRQGRPFICEECLIDLYRASHTVLQRLEDLEAGFERVESKLNTRLAILNVILVITFTVLGFLVGSAWFG
jgi:hypothetical protein